MEDNKYLQGSIRPGVVFRESRFFYKENFQSIFRISLAVFGVVAAFYILFGTISLLPWISDGAIFNILSVAFMFPLTIIGMFIMVMVMVSMAKRINGLMQGNDIGFQESLKNTPVTSLKIAGISYLGALIMEAPLLGMVPVGVIIGILSGLPDTNRTLGIVLTAGLIIAGILFFIAFIAWMLYVGAHLVMIIFTLIVDPGIYRWFRWSRNIVKGKLKSIIGVIAGIYGFLFVISLPVMVISVIFIFTGGSMIFNIILTMLIMLVLVLFVYPYIMIVLTMLYNRIRNMHMNEMDEYANKAYYGSGKPAYASVGTVKNNSDNT